MCVIDSNRPHEAEFPRFVTGADDVTRGLGCPPPSDCFLFFASAGFVNLRGGDVVFPNGSRGESV